MTSPYYDTIRMSEEIKRRELMKEWKSLSESKRPSWEQWKRMPEKKRIDFIKAIRDYEG